MTVAELMSKAKAYSCEIVPNGSAGVRIIWRNEPTPERRSLIRRAVEAMRPELAAHFGVTKEQQEIPWKDYRRGDRVGCERADLTYEERQVLDAMERDMAWAMA